MTSPDDLAPSVVTDAPAPQPDVRVDDTDPLGPVPDEIVAPGSTAHVGPDDGPTLPPEDAPPMSRGSLPDDYGPVPDDCPVVEPVGGSDPPLWGNDPHPVDTWETPGVDPDAAPDRLPLADLHDDLLRREPELAAVLDDAPEFLRHIASDSPDQLERYWKAYTERGPGDAGGFTRYVRGVVQRLERPAAAERNLVLDRADAGEIVLTDPGRPNDRGIDLVTVDPRSGTVRLFDDKSWNRAVGSVGALQRNLRPNLDRVLAEIDPLVYPDHLRAVVEDTVTRLTAARDALAAGHDAGVLRDLDILRVVTNTGGPVPAAVTERLAEAGFVVENLNPRRQAAAENPIDQKGG